MEGIWKTGHLTSVFGRTGKKEKQNLPFTRRITTYGWKVIEEKPRKSTLIRWPKWHVSQQFRICKKISTSLYFASPVNETESRIIFFSVPIWKLHALWKSLSNFISLVSHRLVFHYHLIIGNGAHLSEVYFPIKNRVNPPENKGKSVLIKFARGRDSKSKTNATEPD